MEKSNMIGLSTACISAETASFINEIAFNKSHLYDNIVAYEKGVYGWFVCVPENESELEGIPEDLKKCMLYAKAKDCKWIMFDRDIEYDKNDGLERHMW